MPEYFDRIAWFLLPLSLTILIESGVARLLGERRLRFYGAMLCINAITNPLFCLFLLTTGTTGRPDVEFACEILIVAAEWMLLIAVFPGERRRMLLYSSAMNAASYLSGLLIRYWI